MDHFQKMAILFKQSEVIKMVKIVIFVQLIKRINAKLDYILTFSMIRIGAANSSHLNERTSLQISGSGFEQGLEGGRQSGICQSNLFHCWNNKRTLSKLHQRKYIWSIFCEVLYPAPVSYRESQIILTDLCQSS